MGLITIRPLVPEDICSALELEREANTRPWTRGVFEDELRAPNRRYLAADGGRLVGYAGVMVVGDEAHITNLGVEPTSRRRGIGRRLLRCLMEESEAMGARHVTLEVRSGNHAALALYQRFGFELEGERHRYFGDCDALIMWARGIDDSHHAWRSV